MMGSKFDNLSVVCGKAKWPVNLNRLNQQVVTLGLAYADRGVSLGRLQEALLKIAKSESTRIRLGGKTSRGDTGQGFGYIEQWFVPSWAPKGCRVEKTKNYDYCKATSRIRIFAEINSAQEKLAIARQTIERKCLA